MAFRLREIDAAKACMAGFDISNKTTCAQIMQLAHPLKRPPPGAQCPHLAAQPTCAALAQAAWHGALKRINMQQAGQDARQVAEQRRMGRQDLSDQQLHPAQVLRSTNTMVAGKGIRRILLARDSRTVEGRAVAQSPMLRLASAQRGKLLTAGTTTSLCFGAAGVMCSGRVKCRRTFVGTDTPKTEPYVGDRALRTTLRANRTAEKPMAQSLRACRQAPALALAKT